MKSTALLQALLPLALMLGSGPVWAQNVKITPLGSHAGELCTWDRAMLFEDPTGIRILYDAGRTVTGAEDPRLGDVHVVLLSHAHGDHIGEQKMKALDAGTCASPGMESAGPHSTTAEIAAVKNAVLFMAAEMGVFLGRKVENIRGKPTGVCSQAGDAIEVPQAAPCRASAHLGGTQTFKASGAQQGVVITIVYAAHTNNVPPSLLTEPQRTQLAADNLTIRLGPPTGYVVKFTNGLTVYLSGDTGIHTEMKTVVHDFHKANLAVINPWPGALVGMSAAYAINDLVRPAAVIVSHVNEAATTGGKLRPISRTAAFINLVKGRPVYLSTSGRTMEFDGNARCVAGC